MTILGKMLVFLVLILALIWNGLVVNAYVTKTNWKKQADVYQAKAVEAADAANNMRKVVEAEREASEDKARVLREDRDRLYEQNKSLKGSYDEINKAYQERQKADKEKNIDETRLQANVKTLQDQNADLVKQQDVKDKQIDQLTLESERAKADMVKAQLTAEAQQRRAEQLNETVIRLKELLEEQKRGGGGIEPRGVAPVGFRGTVRAREGSLVAITPGLDAGLQVGAVLTVRRLGANPKYVGKLKVTQVDPKEAVGTFSLPAGATRATAADYPQPGDELVPD